VTFGVIDESAPADGASYAMALVTVQDATSSRADLVSRFPRKRPFHWVEDRGEVVRRRIIDVFDGGTVTASVAVVNDPTGVGGAHRARAFLMAAFIVPWAVDYGLDGLLIERRSRAENEADRVVLKDSIRRARGRMTYDWVAKTEPLAWLADAACGAWDEAVAGDPEWLGELVARGALTDLAVRHPGNASAPGPRS